jgi:hypothetical protein
MGNKVSKMNTIRSYLQGHFRGQFASQSGNPAKIRLFSESAHVYTLSNHPFNFEWQLLHRGG